MQLEERVDGWYASVSVQSEWTGPFKTAAEAEAATSKAASFRHLLLQQCQDEFQKITSATAEGGVVLPTEEEEEEDEESSPVEDVARRRMLAVMSFIGELYKVDLVKGSIVRYCVEKLLDAAERPADDKVEMACRLLQEAGGRLDKPVRCIGLGLGDG